MSSSVEFSVGVRLWGLVQEGTYTECWWGCTVVLLSVGGDVG